MIITARSASAVQDALISRDIWMVDLGNTSLTGYRFQFNYAGEVERFVTLAQVKAWAKYNLPA
jgi:hypothetical protein